ncbi:OLC1v1036368C1 [Oldenlandia corymbosa var. corymbosa]|uniref:OLC1v1036368C1 n=1 Tax=Oldenlandia corymbosa var. corymbosa TaxID=529605 RepID=A0AAV1CWK5_OLDCO|nr:OLC1v1036368C1 [Oldenlandia corymbosa var. corymbosa]
MGKSSGTLVKWREYFLTANTDIFDIIERAIMVAAIDCPTEFKLRRDRIAELLFTCKITKCFGCDKLELAVPNDGVHGKEEEEEKDKFDSGFHRETEIDADRNNGSKGSFNGIDHHIKGEEMEVNLHQQGSSYSYGDAEALTDEIEEESQMFAEVMRIKEILDNGEDESDAVLYDSLRRLQLMLLSVEVLKATEIGKSVNALRRHGSKQIRQLAKTLVDGWVVMVDEWMSAAATVVNEGTPESMKKSDLVDEEEGLPSPPLDEGFLFTTQSIPMELSQLFDGMDDDGNPQNSGEFNKNRDKGKKSSMDNQNVPKQKQKVHGEGVTPPKDWKSEQLKKQQPGLKKQEAVVKQQAAYPKTSKPSSGGVGPGRPTKPVVGLSQSKPQQNSDKLTTQKREVPQQNKMRSSDEAAVLLKLEASKRKLQERYREAQNG